jgi:hypothetical protein
MKHVIFRIKPLVTTRSCKVCGQEKVVSEFKKEGLVCKQCDTLKKTKKYTTDPRFKKKTRENQTIYYKNIREQIFQRFTGRSWESEGCPVFHILHVDEISRNGDFHKKTGKKLNGSLLRIRVLNYCEKYGNEEAKKHYKIKTINHLFTPLSDLIKEQTKKAEAELIRSQIRQEVVMLLTGRDWKAEGCFPFVVHHTDKVNRNGDFSKNGRPLDSINLYKKIIFYCDIHGIEAGRKQYSLETPGQHKIIHKYQWEIAQQKQTIAILMKTISILTPK